MPSVVEGHPASFVEVPTGRRPKAVVWTPARIEAWKRTGVRPAVAVWTAEDAGAFLDSISEHRLYPLFHLVAYRGAGLNPVAISAPRRATRATRQPACA